MAGKSGEQWNCIWKIETATNDVPEGQSKNFSIEKQIKVVSTIHRGLVKIKCQIIYVLNPLMTVKSVGSRVAEKKE